MTEKTRIYVAFLSSSVPWGNVSSGRPVGYEAYRRHHPDVPIPEHEDILADIKSRAPDVEFVGGTELVKADDAAAAVKEKKEELDGLLLFDLLSPWILDAVSDGRPEGELPAVVVERPLQRCSTATFDAFKEHKAVPAFVPAHRDKDPEVYSRRLDDIARKARVIGSIGRMRGLRILVVTDKPPLGYFEPTDYQTEGDREDYEQLYLENLKTTLGAVLVPVAQKTLFEKVRDADEEEAKEVARVWIDGSLGLRGIDEAGVLMSAKLYLGMKELMNEHNCGAVTTEGFGWPPLGFQKAVEHGVPSQGIPTSQFLTDGVAAASETLTDCLLTQQLALHMTGSGGLLGDYTIDPGNDTAIIAHCEGTFKPHVDRPAAPYAIRNLPFVDENTGGACAEIHYPIGEPVTVAKLSVHEKKLSLFSGETVSGENLFPHWEDILGRNKIAVRTNARALLENVDWKTFGNHRTAFFGDHRQQFADLARLIGYQLVEKDR